MLRFVDILLVLLGAAISLALDLSPLGYSVGAGSWILLRGLGAAVDTRAGAVHDIVGQLSLRLGFRLTRVGLVVAATLLARHAGGNEAGLTALLVMTGGFTAHLAASVIRRRSLGQYDAM